MKRFVWMYCAYIAFSACSKSPDTQGPDVIIDPPVVGDTTPVAKYDITLLANSTAFLTTPEVHAMQRQDYNELSGIAASQVNKGILYVHEDDKGTRTIAITNAKGDDLGQIILDNVSTQNLEDMAAGPGPVAGKTYIYLADIGDNNAARSSVAVYRFEEPVLNNPGATTQVHITAVDKLEFRYPKSAVNAETFMFDPLTKDMYIATKEAGKSYVYLAPYPQSATAVTVLKPVVGTHFDLLTSGDISPDGTEILLRNKGQIFYWKRSPAVGITAALLTAPQMAPYSGNERQGEGICFSADAGGYFTNTEIKDHAGALSNISFYKRK